MALSIGKEGEMRIVLRVKDDGTAVVEKFGETSDRTAQKTSVNWKRVGAVVAAAGAAAAISIGALIQNQIDSADAAIKTADKLGMTVEALTGLRFHADLAGVSSQNLNVSLQMMARQLADAAQGTGEAKDAIAALGLNADVLAKMKPEQAVGAIADAMERIPEGSAKVQIAMDIFGRSGADMINVMRGGKDAIRAGMEEAQRFGQVIATETARQAEEFNDNISRLKANLTGMANAVLPAVTEALVKMTNAMLGRESVDSLTQQLADLVERRRVMLQGIGSTVFAGRSPLEGINKEIDEVNAKIAEANRKLANTRAREAARLKSPAVDVAGIKRAREQAEQTAELRKELAAQVEELRQSGLTELQLAQEKFDNELILLIQAREFKAITEEELDQLDLERIERFEKARQEIELQSQSVLAQQLAAANAARSAMWQAAWQGDLASMAGVLGEMSGLMTSGSKTIFKIGKAAALAEAAVSMYQSISNALATKPFVPVGLAMGAVATAKGLANIAKIKSINFGSEAGAVGTFSANPATGLPATTPGTLFSAPVQPDRPPAPTVIVNIEGNIIGNRQFVDDVMVPGLEDFFRRDGVLFNSQTRQAVEIVPT